MFSLFFVFAWSYVLLSSAFYSSFKVHGDVCHRLLSTWEENPFKIMSISFTSKTSTRLHSIAIKYLRSGENPCSKLLFLYSSFRKKSIPIENNLSALQKFFLHIFCYLMLFLYCSEYLSIELYKALSVYHFLFSIVLYQFLPKTGLLDDGEEVFGYLESGLESLLPRTTNSSNFEFEVQKSLVIYESNSSRFLAYLSIAEIIYLGPLLLLFSAYFFLSSAGRV